jgi:hypothetical protein
MGIRADDVVVLSDVRVGRVGVRSLAECRLTELRGDPGEHPVHVVLRGKLYKRPDGDNLARASTIARSR